MAISINGKWFVDEKGRKVILRGVNLGGSTKVPFSNGATHIKTDFSDHQDVSFVNRPFPIDEADEHFRRLKNWGFNTLRLLTTWEAIEHKGPGIYDSDYIDYFAKICEIAARYDFYTFVDPHQDVWSRMTGGDGAPGWTFDKIGIDITKLAESDAALTMQHHYPENYPQMSWAMNHYRFGVATMFSLFFGGNDFAPNCKVDGVPVQEFFQSHFINSIAELAKPLQEIDNIIGFGPMNEPGTGYIGVENLNNQWKSLIIGKAPTPFDTMIAASGYSIDVPFFKQKLLGLRKTGEEILNPNEINLWKSDCIWKKEGVWEEDKDGIPILLKPDHFIYGKKDDIHFFRDYLKPFSIDFTDKIRSIIPEAIIFLEGQPIEGKGIIWENSDPVNIVNAGHWYDVATLVTKKYRAWATLDIKRNKLVFRHKNVRKAFLNQLQTGVNNSKSIQNGIPSLIGEFGIPFDLNNKKSYRTGDYKTHIAALSLYYDLLDELMLNSTLWNYTSDNSNEWGDLWNLEDLSIFSRDQQSNPDDLNSGGRAIEGFCRPYPIKIAGEPINYSFNQKRGIFRLTYINDPSLDYDTIIFVPKIQYPHGYDLSLSNGESKKLDQSLRIRSGREGGITVEITKI
ncbi:MAG: glycoside hydrolase family 5 protein [Candidatus Heimdallarchaeota archaeon]|nr:glycoside hydrolase family 5 protein [Candidatus Heimdallarchaeota archaeon]